MDALNLVVNNDPIIQKAIYGRSDASGATTELALWTELGNDMFSAVARSARIVNSLERVLGGKIAFFHSKLTLKRQRSAALGIGIKTTAIGIETGTSFRIWRAFSSR